MTYVPLHVYSIYSPFEGMIRPEELVSRASFLKLPAIALTDLWTTYGHYKFFNLAREAGIKPILGVELQHMSLIGGGELYRLTALAESDLGYRNLISLVNKHYTKEKKNYITPEELAEHRNGLIVLTGCLEGEAGQAILHGNLGREREVVEKLLQIFGPSNLFLEIMNHNLAEERLVTDHFMLLSKRLGVPLVVTNKDRYLQKEEEEYYGILRLLGHKEVNGKDGEALGEYYLKKEKDLEPYFYSISDALHESGRIAERCNVELGKPGQVSFSSRTNAHDTLTKMCHRRFLLKFHNKPRDEISYLKSLMVKELDSASREGMSEFLIFFRDLFQIAAERGVWVELMGSDLLDSLIAYLMDIAPLNPVSCGLIFESFSSPRRGVPPAVELVKSKGSKGRLIRIIKELIPGYQPLLQVTQEEMSFHTIVKEVGDTLGISKDLHDELSRIIASERRYRPLVSMLEGSEPLRRIYNSEGIVRRTLHAAQALHGRIRHFNLNSSRLVFLPRELESITSYITGSDGERFVLLSKSTIEAMGGCILGIQHSHFLSALEKAVKQVEMGQSGMPSLYSTEEVGGGRWVPEVLDDPQTFAMISSGDTTGVYLLESQGVRDLLIKIKPSAFDEIVNVISLYRPAPLEGRLWQRYMENAEKKGRVYLPHPSLAAPLEKTRGLLLYKEQVREILSCSAGLEGERAVAVENALKNQDTGELLSARLEFIRGAMDQGIDEEDAQRTFDFLMHNIVFTHDRALSCSQAYLSYRTAFFKAHHFEEYFTSLLNSNMDVKERLKRYCNYLEEMGVDLLSVDINASGYGYSREKEGIRVPLQVSKSLEVREREEVLKERYSSGDFTNLGDFLGRMSGRISMRAVMGLIDEGAFDCWGRGSDELMRICRKFYGGEEGADLLKAEGKITSHARKRKESNRQLSFFDNN